VSKPILTGSVPLATDYLSDAHKKRDDVEPEWDQDNQQWWNWYMTLADNAADTAGPATDKATYKAEPGAAIDPSELTRIHESLSDPYHLDQDCIDQFSNKGYIKLKNVIDPAALKLLRRQISSILLEVLGQKPGLAFRSNEMMWLHDDLVRRFVLSKRVAQIAAKLLNVDAVRLYHDNALSKEPGCGRTPWHYDYHHFPIDSMNVCTAWIPLQRIPQEMGPLTFAAAMDTYKLVKNLSFNKFDASYDKELGKIFSENGVPIDDSAFDLGEVSFHHTLSFHTAGANMTNESRMALATTYFEDGARLVSNPTMISGDFHKFMPGIKPGDLINSHYNPVCYDSVRQTAKELYMGVDNSTAHN
tara:strand:+ start:10010 stop:11086 length:1077 start_codon:yes stop_codon:yes gene_type:complete